MNANTRITPEVGTEPDDTPRKPRVALMGEFSAGKSTLANVLLGSAPLPVRVTATRLPPVWISHGPESAAVVGPDGQETMVDRADLSSGVLEDAQLIRLTQEAPILDLCDLIDMPGISDPNMAPSLWQTLMAEVDHVIWCTHATQAWRQSEAAVWQTLAEDLPGGGLLLVTQIDKLRSERDKARVLARLRKETQGQFREVFPISLLDALAAGEDREGWQGSGAGEFVEQLVELLLTPGSDGAGLVAPQEPQMPAVPQDPQTAAPPPRIVPRRVLRVAGDRRRHARPAADAEDVGGEL